MTEVALSKEVVEAVQQAVDARIHALAPRVGIGYDIHRFSQDRALVLCGVEVPSAVGGLLGHSDADAATHAIIDAVLGAAALGDIGHFFPDSDARWKNVSSLHLLKTCRLRVETEGYRVSSVDVTIITEKPVLAPHVPKMRETLGGALELPPSAVSVKATTNEKLGAVGSLEGLAAIACAVLVRTGVTP